MYGGKTEHHQMTGRERRLPRNLTESRRAAPPFLLDPYIVLLQASRAQILHQVAQGPPKMSFDAFEARLHFLQLLRKLNASQPSIQKVVSYAIKYGSRCGEDLWECITEECSKVALKFIYLCAVETDTVGLAEYPYKHLILPRLSAGSLSAPLTEGCALLRLHR